MDAKTVLRERMQGPVVGLPTLFNHDFSVNHAGMRRHVEFLIERGIPVLMLSFGISEWRSLSFDEAVEVTRTVASAAGGRVPVITTTGEWWTGQCMDYVRAAGAAGADGCLVVPMGTYYTSYDPALQDESYYRHFQAIAAVTPIPLLIHERNVPGRSSGTPLSIGLVDRLADLPAVAGVKLEGGGPAYALELVPRVRDRIAVVGDWGPMFFAFAYEYGVRANITGVGQFAPALSLEYYQHLQAGRLDAARHMVNTVLEPIYAAEDTMDWVAAIKAGMECVGLPAGPMRPPLAQLTTGQRTAMREALGRVGVVSG
jgi:dihydrodipicolinate synthase/N-acetylneuraminate lyase